MTDKPKKLTKEQREATQKQAHKMLCELDKATDALAEDGSLWAATVSAEMAVSRLYISLMLEYRTTGAGADKLFVRFMQDVVLPHLQRSPAYMMAEAIFSQINPPEPSKPDVAVVRPAAGEDEFEAELSALMEKYGMAEITRIEGDSPQEIIDILSGITEANKATKQ